MSKIRLGPDSKTNDGSMYITLTGNRTYTFSTFTLDDMIVINDNNKLILQNDEYIFTANKVDFKDATLIFGKINNDSCTIDNNSSI